MYSIRTKSNWLGDDFESWNAWCNFVNEEQKYSTTLHFSDYKNHENINLLPSWHPYWKFIVYLKTKQIAWSNARVARTYQAMLDGDGLDAQNRTRVLMSLHEHQKAVRVYTISYKEQQIKLNERRTL